MPVPSILRRVRYLLRRDRAAAELEEEMQLHLALRAEAMAERQRLDPHDARYAARRRFGNVTAVAERSRDMWGLETLDQIAQDARFAARRLRQRPAFSIPIIAVLALGVGATTAVFSVVDAAILRPLPFARPQELVTLTQVAIPFDQERDERFPVDLEDVRGMRDVFSHAAGFAAGGLNLSDPSNPVRVRVGVVTADFFATLGVTPSVGRGFTADEGRPHGPAAVVLSHGFWQRQFGGREMLGRNIALNGKPIAVVGIMPPRFSFPNESDLWIPMTVPTTFDTFEPFRGYLPSRVVARRAPGVTARAASARLLSLWEQLAGPEVARRAPYIGEYLDEIRSKGSARPLQEELAGTRRTALLVLLGATALLLLIVCANVANLLLSDAAARRREIAVREVLGATRRRVVRQLLAESLLLSLGGAILGLGLAPAALDLLRAMLPSDLAGIAPPQVDLRVLGFATLLAVVTALAFGLWPAIGTSRVDAGEVIKSGGGHGATAGRLGRARRILVTAELALTVMLLVGAGLMLRSLDRLLSQERGMSTERVATLELSFARASGGRAGKLAIVHAVLDRLAATAGIEASGAVNDLPLRGGGGLSVTIDVDGAPSATGPDDMKFARYLIASGGYFKALGIPILRGRTFTPVDDSLAPRVAIIGKTMADTWWRGVGPIGRTFRMPGDSVPIAIVGIAADVREGALDKDVPPQMYFPIDVQTPDNIAIVARGTLPPSALLARLTEAVRAADRAQPAFNVRMMDDVVSKSVAPRKTNTVLIALFAGLALLLSALGVYAVVAYGVAQRAREFGIRAALGATGDDLVALVSSEMVRLVVFGVGIGLAGAWMLSQVLGSLLYGVDVHDLPTFVVVPLVLIVPATIATLLPAVRAARVSPTEVMRAD